MASRTKVRTHWRKVGRRKVKVKAHTKKKRKRTVQRPRRMTKFINIFERDDTQNFLDGLRKDVSLALEDTVLRGGDTKSLGELEAAKGRLEGARAALIEVRLFDKKTGRVATDRPFTDDAFIDWSTARIELQKEWPKVGNPNDPASEPVLIEKTARIKAAQERLEEITKLAQKQRGKKRVRI